MYKATLMTVMSFQRTSKLIINTTDLKMIIILYNSLFYVPDLVLTLTVFSNIVYVYQLIHVQY